MIAAIVPHAHHIDADQVNPATALAMIKTAMTASVRARKRYLRALTAAAVTDSRRRRRDSLSESATRRSGSAGGSRPDESSTYSYSPSPMRTNTLPTIADSRRIEALLPQLARDYPNLFIPLLALEHDLPAEQRGPTLHYIGQRVGAWIYKRDFALGGHLDLADSVRHIALPALRQIVQAEVHDDALLVRNSPFCHRGQAGACCHFLRGMLDGLLGAPHGTVGLQVREHQCRNVGADVCHFHFHA